MEHLDARTVKNDSRKREGLCTSSYSMLNYKNMVITYLEIATRLEGKVNSTQINLSL